MGSTPTFGTTAGSISGSIRNRRCLWAARRRGRRLLPWNPRGRPVLEAWGACRADAGSLGELGGVEASDIAEGEQGTVVRVQPLERERDLRQAPVGSRGGPPSSVARVFAHELRKSLTVALRGPVTPASTSLRRAASLRRASAAVLALTRRRCRLPARSVQMSPQTDSLSQASLPMTRLPLRSHGRHLDHLAATTLSAPTDQ